MNMKTGGRFIAAAVFVFALAIHALAQSASLSVVSASVETDKRSGQPVLAIEISKESSEKLAALTRDHVGRRMELRVDGKVLSAPVIREPILGTKFQISGNGTAADFDAIVKNLKSGDLIEVAIVPQ
jgi:preprotein translocase subunit SecD